MRKIIFAFSLFILIVLSSASLASPQQKVYADEIAVTGTVYYWTLEDVYGSEDCDDQDDFTSIQGGKYLPLKNTYIESEYVRWGNDPDSYTHDNGYYYLKNTGLVEGSYDVNLEIRAKTIMNSRLTLIGWQDTVVSIFKDSLDVYAVNVETDSYSIHTGDILTLDVYIGGPENNLIDGDTEGFEALTSYWLAQDLRNYYRKVILQAPDPGDLPWDIYLKYPRSRNFYNPFILPTKGHIELKSEKLFPSQVIDSGFYCTPYQINKNWKELQGTARHEYTHQIMDMVFNDMPADATSDHAPNGCTNAETAWVEGFAEFLPAAMLNWPTTQGVRGKENLEFNYNPYMTAAPGRRIINEPFNPIYPPEKGLGSIDWHYKIMEGCDQPENSEGEVAAVLWDIYDLRGWEYLPEAVQPAATSTSTAGLPPSTWKRPLRWYDRITDSSLSDFWRIFKRSPGNLVGDHTTGNTSFWAKWLDEYGNDEASIHGLKAILFNRGINPEPKPEQAPSIEQMTIDEANRRINLTISEEDPEDRDFLYINIGYMKQLDGNEFSYYYTEDKPVSDLSTTWQDGHINVSVDIPRGKLGRVNGVLVHDSMLVDYESENITPLEESFYLSCASRQPNTFATAVAIQGNIAYVTDMESGLYIYDLSNPLQPVQLSLLRSDMNSNETPWGGAMDVAVDGSYAYIAAYSGALVIVDVSNPANPVLTGYIAIEGAPRAVALSGTKAYVVNGTGGMSIIDIDYPNSPGVDRALETGGAFDIVISDNQAFVAVDGGVQIFSLGVFPHYLGVISIPGDAVTGVTVGADGLVYLATRNGTVQVFDISTWDPVLANLLTFFLMETVDPEIAFPVKIDELAVGGWSGRIMLSGKSLYSGSGVYDVSNPELLYKMASLTGNEIALKGDVVYAAADTLGFLAYSRTNLPGAESNCGLGGGEGSQNGYLEAAGTWQGHINDMAFARDHGFLAAGQKGLIIVSVKDPKNIQQVATYDEPDKLNAMGVDIDSTGSMVFLPSMAGDLQILDITNPEVPKRLGLVAWNKHDDVGAWQDVTSQYGFVFVCAGSGGVRALDVRDPTNPPWKGTFTTAITDCSDVAVSLPIVYALGFSSGLHIFEMTGPMLHTTPEFLERAGWSLPQGISGTNYSSLYLDESRKLLYVSSLWNGVTILDISNSSQPPVVLGSIDPGRAYGMAGSGNLLYVGDDQVVHVIDVSDVHNPKLVAEQELTDRYGLEMAAIVLKVYNGYLYVATSQDTLQAYRIMQ